MNFKMKRKYRPNTLKSPYFENKPEESNAVESTIIPKNIALSLNTCRYSTSFFDAQCVDLAKSLLGKVLVRVLSNGTTLKGRIVETESYLGGEDKASISYGGKITAKSKPMYMKPGTTFVYLTYGMYNLINISSHGDGAAVLIRALDPFEGEQQMARNRSEFRPNKNKPKKESKEIPTHQLCNGPAKLCISMNITKEECNMQDLDTWSEMWVEPGETIPENHIVKSRRIGIDSAGPEWANKLLRFYMLNNKSVSKRDKVQEDLLRG